MEAYSASVMGVLLLCLLSLLVAVYSGRSKGAAGHYPDPFWTHATRTSFSALIART